MLDWIPVLILTFTSLLIYFIILLVSSFYYYDYLRGRFKALKLYALLIVPPIGMILLIISPFLLVVYTVLSNYLSYFICEIILLLPLLLFILKTLLKYTCRSIKKCKINSIEYITCETDSINAWYMGGKLYISNKLHKVLTKDEIKAIVLHEKGHRERKWIGRVNNVVSVSWYLVTITVTLFLPILLRLGANVEATVSIMGFIIPLVPSITVLAMSWSWVQEHECDIIALKEASFRSIVSALIKAHIYGSIEKYLDYISSIRLNQETLLKQHAKIRYLNVLKHLLKYSWNAPLWYLELIKHPIYLTHPPLEYRLLKLIIEAKNQKHNNAVY